MPKLYRTAPTRVLWQYRLPLPMNPPLRGLVAAPFTPFDKHGALAESVIPIQARALARTNVIGAFICGSTGEGASLSSEERRRMTESWVTAARPLGLQVIVHVGHASLPEAAALAAHAQDTGADAIATLSPHYFKPKCTEALVAWCAQVAAAAPALPFYYYHIPAITGVTIPTAEFLKLAREKIPTLAGIKFTYEDKTDFAKTVREAGGRYEVLFGRDELLLDSLKLGARTAVGSTYNYAAPLFQKILKAYALGDLDTATRDQARARAFIDVLEKFGGLPAGKVIMRFIGIDVGPPRLPLSPLALDEERRLHRELSQIGFFDYASSLSA